MLEIRVIGLPAPKGSRRFVGLSKAGRGILIESSKKCKPWSLAVKYETMTVRENAGMRGPMGGPVEVVMVFTMPKPKSAPKSRETWPDKKPDIDKLVRSTSDALVEAGAIEDDARIVTLWARKVFPGSHPDALDVPGVVIRISAVSAAKSAGVK